MSSTKSTIAELIASAAAEGELIIQLGLLYIPGDGENGGVEERLLTASVYLLDEDHEIVCSASLPLDSQEMLDADDLEELANVEMADAGWGYQCGNGRGHTGAGAGPDGAEVMALVYDAQRI